MKKITFLMLLILPFYASTAQTALDFEPDANNQHVEILDILCPSEVTIEVWVNYRGQTGGFPTILEFGNDSPFFGLDNDNFITLFDVVSSTTTLTLNEWNHIAVTYSAATTEGKLYINGVLNATRTGEILVNDGVGAGIGYNNFDEVFNGSIDDLRIWNVVRTEDEIADNINTCLTGSEPNLYAFYNFNEGSGTVLNDLSGNNFNGTLINMDPVTDWIAYDSCNTLSIDPQTSDLQIGIYPNPSSDFVSISGLKNKTDYTLYNVLGAEVLEGTLELNDKINIQNLKNGVYLLKLNTGITFKIIKD